MWQSYEVFIVWTKYLANTSSFDNKILPLYMNLKEYRILRWQIL